MNPDLRARIEAHRWYHTIDLGDGVVTRGWFDLRPHVGAYGLPGDLTGRRVLDVGTWDGFWALEMARRGADVVALDVDHEAEYDVPPRRRPAQPEPLDRGAGLRLALEATGLRVERVVRNVYEALPEELGTFDLVFCGHVLIHLRDQLRALERLAGLCRGQLILAEEYDPATSLLPVPVARYHADRDRAVVFWLPSRRTWRRMTWTAGFEDVREHGRFALALTTDAGTRRIPTTVVHARGTAG